MEKDTNSLKGMIDQAEKSLPKPKPSGGDRANHASRTPIALMALTVAVFVWGWQFWSSTISAEQIRLDLKTLVGQARSQIESELLASGHLPVALADRTLAKVVRYEIVDGNTQPAKYRLVAELSGISESWSSE